MTGRRSLDVATEWFNIDATATRDRFDFAIELPADERVPTRPAIDPLDGASMDESVSGRARPERDVVIVAAHVNERPRDARAPTLTGAASTGGDGELDQRRTAGAETTLRRAVPWDRFSRG